MKSERRHELQQNDLAIYLNKINKSIEPYSRFIAIAVGVLIVGGISLGLYNSQQTGKRSDATLQLLQASATQDAEDLLTVSESYPDTTAGDWARLYQGKQYLSDGIQALYNDRDDAEELLTDAQTAFNRALSSSKDRLLVSRANLGIARAAESLGEIDAAIEAYQQVIAVNESEAMTELAQRRIDTLGNPDTKDFLAWFADQDFSPADPSLPPSLPGATQIPGMPDFKLPGLDLDFEGGVEPRNLEGGIELPEVGTEGQPADEPNQDGAEEGGIQLPGGEIEVPVDESTEGPAPATEDPAPATEDPAPATEDPAPATEDPAPATEDPAPATEDPAPATEDPAPATEDPAPATEDPAPATEDPAPATEGPAAGNDEASSDS